MAEDKKKEKDQAIEPENEELQEEAAEEVVEGDSDAEDQRPLEEQWREALELTVKQRDEYLAMAQRAQADFQNFKRRNATVRADAYDDGVRETLAALLPALDNLERALQAADADAGKLAEGVEMTRKQMLEAMTKLGLEEVPALGEPFDPDMHNAVMRVEEGEPGTVLEVFEKGYRVKGRMIRYAMVKVAAEK